MYKFLVLFFSIAVYSTAFAWMPSEDVKKTLYDRCDDDQIFYTIRTSWSKDSKLLPDSPSLKSLCAPYHKENDKYLRLIDEASKATSESSLVSKLSAIRQYAACGFDGSDNRGGQLSDFVAKQVARFNGGDCLGYWRAQIDCVLGGTHHNIPQYFSKRAPSRDSLPNECPKLDLIPSGDGKVTPIHTSRSAVPAE